MVVNKYPENASGRPRALVPAWATLDFEQKRNWLRLIRTPNIGPITFRKLIGHYHTAEAALDALQIGGRNVPRCQLPSMDSVERELDLAADKNVSFISLGEPDYPDELRFVPDAPPLISCVGQRTVLKKPFLAIVGSRESSANGCRLAFDVASLVADAGYGVISGFARGIDTSAHRASLHGGTVGVLAGGVDWIYPRENTKLYQDIQEQGALISEMPLGFQPRGRDFPNRNRIIAGAAFVVMIVEAAERSGSLITARIAREYNRDIIAVPGSPYDPRAQGTNRLIKNGAHVLTSPEDILDILDSIRKNPMTEFVLRENFSSQLFDAPDSVDDTLDAATDIERNMLSAQSTLLRALSFSPTSFDILKDHTGLSAQELQSELFDLEMAGRAQKSQGNSWSLKI